MDKPLSSRGKEILAANVRQFCEDNDISFSQLATEINVHRNWITAIAGARANVTMDLLGKIAERFKTSIVKLIGDPPSKKTELVRK